MERPRSVVVNTYPAAEVARLLLVVLGFGIGVYVLWRIQEVLFLLFVAILVATAIEAIVNRLRRGPFTRGLHGSWSAECGAAGRSGWAVRDRAHDWAFLAFAPAVVVALTVSPGTAVVGSALYGLPGGFLAVPVAGAIQVVVAHTLRAEDPAQAEEHAVPHERLQQQVGSHGPAAEAVAANP